MEERIALPPGDYVSPNFKVVRLDQAFPFMVVGDRCACRWPYLRREVPHNWYVDRRLPLIGFVNRDEAHILYNTALAFGGKRALEIGCWLGWSACHLALGGVRLDVVDPLLARPDFHQNVTRSLSNVGVLESVNLVPKRSPEAIREAFERHGEKWSLIFIDGDHDAPGPLRDAQECLRFAEDDALILLHDLASPDVAAALDFLRAEGWKTMLYQTMQIMAVAWRGGVRPAHHLPDPAVHWTLPSQLASYPVSGMN
ncbi:MAG: class I SAM-dependent methyltransferase [Verrucomicrobia bacterium]|nr:class I SAM-dependent methyltransferase [Verrucomicrobiota bacterium]